MLAERLQTSFSWPENVRLHEDNTFGYLTLDAEEKNIFTLKYDEFEAKITPSHGIELVTSGNLPKNYFFERIALPFLRILNGYLLLHASALSTPSGGVVFLAPSGIGKSTIAALLLSFPDIRFIADDIATLLSDQLYPLSSQLAMRHAMADSSDYVESIESNGYKRLLNIRRDKLETNPVPLKCLCLLESGKPSDPVFAPFSEVLPQILAQQLKLSHPPTEFARAQFRAIFTLQSIPCMKAVISCQTKDDALCSAQRIYDAIKHI